MLFKEEEFNKFIKVLGVYRSYCIIFCFFGDDFTSCCTLRGCFGEVAFGEIFLICGVDMNFKEGCKRESNDYTDLKVVSEMVRRWNWL